jgi:hypothetical protein
MDPTAALSTCGSLALAHRLCGDAQAGHALARRTLNEVRAISRPMGHAMTTGLAHLAEVMVEAFAQDRRSSEARADPRAAGGMLRRQAFVCALAGPAYRDRRAGWARGPKGETARGCYGEGFDTATALEMTADVLRLRDALSRWFTESLCLLKSRPGSGHPLGRVDQQGPQA